MFDVQALKVWVDLASGCPEPLTMKQALFSKHHLRGALQIGSEPLSTPCVKVAELRGKEKNPNKHELLFFLTFTIVAGSAKRPDHEVS